jgi:hypothetical protein
VIETIINVVVSVFGVGIVAYIIKRVKDADRYKAEAERLKHERAKEDIKARVDDTALDKLVKLANERARKRRSNSK